MTLRWQVRLNSTSIKTKVLQNASINWGRTDINRQPDPATCTVVIRREPDDAVDPDLIVGNFLNLWVGQTGVLTQKRCRFYGTIVDVQLDRYTYTITAVSLMAWLVKYQAGYSNPFAEGPAYQGVVVSTGQNVDAFTSNLLPVNPQVNADTGENTCSWWYDQGTYSPWEMAQAFTAGETSGVLGEDFLTDTTGFGYEIRFTDATARRETTPQLVLTETEILWDWTVEQQVSDKVTQLTVSSLGNEYLGWPAGSTVFTDNTDTPGFSFSLAASYSDAESIRKVGTSIVGLQAIPGYRLHRITIPMSTLTDTRQNAIMDAIKLSALIEIPELMPGFPTLYFVEGTTENVAQPDGWTLDLHVSEASLTHPPDRWIDVDPTLTWATVSPSLEWRAAYKERFS